VPRLEFQINIAAPCERVFDLARSIDLHKASMASHHEEAIAGVTSGLIGPGETVTWRARQFGLPVRLTSRITVFDPPHRFADAMVSGPFKSFSHEHVFERTSGGTVMRDVFDYRSPLGLLGRLADWLFLERHMKKLLAARNAIIKQVAESTEWPKYLAAADGSHGDV